MCISEVEPNIMPILAKLRNPNFELATFKDTTEQANAVDHEKFKSLQKFILTTQGNY